MSQNNNVPVNFNAFNSEGHLQVNRIRAKADKSSQPKPFSKEDINNITLFLLVQLPAIIEEVKEKCPHTKSIPKGYYKILAELLNSLSWINRTEKEIKSKVNKMINCRHHQIVKKILNISEVRDYFLPLLDAVSQEVCYKASMLNTNVQQTSQNSKKTSELVDAIELTSKSNRKTKHSQKGEHSLLNKRTQNSSSQLTKGDPQKLKSQQSTGATSLKEERVDNLLDKENKISYLYPSFSIAGDESDLFSSFFENEDQKETSEEYLDFSF